MNLIHKVIYDTDPGVDDAIALYFALAHPAIDLIGITTTFGNVSVAQAAVNALYLTAIAGRDIAVTQGVAAPLNKTPVAPPAFIHGADGLGNLATALQLEPALPALLKQVIVMGGTVLEPGNVSPVAEANIWNDPHAADRVFAAPWKLTMVGLDVTHRVVTELSFFERLARRQDHIATDTLLHAVSFYATFYSGLYKHVAKIPGCFAHDLLAFIYLVKPEFFTLETGCIRVACEGLAQGQTILNRRDFIDYPQSGWEGSRNRSQVCMQVDAPACLNLLEVTLMADWLKN